MSLDINTILYGVTNLPWWGYVLALLGLTQITVLAVTLYLHRCQSHRALTLHPIVSHFFRFWLWLTTGMVTKAFTAIHRKHHARVETEEDPHSPQTRGLRKVLFEGAELYQAEAANAETLQKYGEGTPDDWIEHHLYQPHNYMGIMLMLTIDVILFGIVGIAFWAVQMAWIPFFASGVINGVGHFFGYRNFECKDASRNILPLGIFLGGEELHNNHHAYASSAKFSAHWWEIDSGWYLIRLLQIFKLAAPKRTLPKLNTSPHKKQIDADTLTALIAHRFQVLAGYSREVMLPVLQEERKRASKAGRILLSRAKAVLIRDTSLMKAVHKKRLAFVLENYHSLQVIYQFRIRLQEIWGKSTASQKELLQALQDWCQQAEATGMESLSRFSNRLKALQI